MPRVIGLTPKQKMFVQEYLRDLNATQACIRAGYSARTAMWIAQQLLAKPHVAEAVAAAMAKRERRTEITQDRVLRELGRIGLSDLRQAFDANGRLLPPKEWPAEFAPAVAAIEVVTKNLGDGDVEYVHKLKLWDKNSALEKIARHLGMLRDKIELSGRDGAPLAAVIYLPDNGRDPH